MNQSNRKRVQFCRSSDQNDEIIGSPIPTINNYSVLESRNYYSNIPIFTTHSNYNSTAHETNLNASGSSSSSHHHGASSVSYQTLPGASSTQDFLSSTTSTSSLHSIDRDEIKPATAICVRTFPVRSTDSNIKDGLYHEFKKYGRIISVRVFDQGIGRYAIVYFKKPEEAERALNESKDKQFFGNRIEVTLCENLDHEEQELSLKTNETELDEYHPRATRTLFVGNLDKDITKSDLTNRFGQFGEILEIDIKSQSHQPYAFIQFTDISSVVKAMRRYDGEMMSGTRLKCGFGKSFPSSCIWLCDNIDPKDRAFPDEKVLINHMRRYGTIKNHMTSRDCKSTLIFFESSDEARKAVEELHNKVVNGRKVQVDFASRDFQTYFMTKSMNKSDDTHRIRSAGSGWTINLINDYEDRPYENSRSRNMYHHHQTTSRSTSSSIPSQLLRTNSGSSSSNSGSGNGNGSSYSNRQRSPSPSTSSPVSISGSSFSSFSRSSTNSLKSSKYDSYHHESSSSRLPRTSYRYDNDEIDEINDDLHLNSSSSTSKRDSSRYRSHHLSENYLNESSPKSRSRESGSPYVGYGSSSKGETEFGYRSRSSTNEDLKVRDDDSQSTLRRLNHGKSYHKGRDNSPPMPPPSSTFVRKSGLASSSSSSSSGGSRSPIRDSKGSYYNQDRLSVSPPTSPRNSNAHHYHDSDPSNELSLVDSTKSEKDYHSTNSWRRKSTEDNSNQYYRDYSSSDNGRVRTESISESTDATFPSTINSQRDHATRESYYRSRESHLHRTNSSPSPSPSMTYSSRSESLKRKHSTLDSDDLVSDPSGHLERRKRLLACLEQSPSMLNNNSVSSSINHNTSSNAVASVTKNLLSTMDQRISSSKSLDSIELNGSSNSGKSHPTKIRDELSLSSIDLLKRRTSNNGPSSAPILASNNDNGSNSGTMSIDLKLIQQFLGDADLTNTDKRLQNFGSSDLVRKKYSLQNNISLTSSSSTSPPNSTIGSNCVGGIIGSGLNHGSIMTSSCNSKTKSVTKEIPQVMVNLSKSLDGSSSPPFDPRINVHPLMNRKRASCDNDLSNHKNSFDSSISLISPLSSHHNSFKSGHESYGPKNPMLLPLPEFALTMRINCDSLDRLHPATTLATAATTSTTSSTTNSTFSSVVITSSSTLTCSAMSSITTSITTLNSGTTSTTTTVSSSGSSSIVANLNANAATITTTTSSIAHIDIPTFGSNTSPKCNNIMSPRGSHSPVPKSRLSRDRPLSNETNCLETTPSTAATFALAKRLLNESTDDVTELDEISNMRTTTSLDDQIKALDEKINAWSGTTISASSSLKTEKTPTIDYSKYNIKKKSQSTNVTANNSSANALDNESSDLIKNLLGKSSVFDEDMKRLQNINEKYEPKELPFIEHDTVASLTQKAKANTMLRTKTSGTSNDRTPTNPLNFLVSMASSNSVRPTEKSSLVSSHDLPKTTSSSLNNTSTTTSSQHHHSSASSLSSSSSSSQMHHFNHQHVNFFASANVSNSSSMSRKLSDPNRVASLKKDSSFVSTSSPSPNTPSSAPVRSTSNTMFPQFQRSSSHPTTCAPCTPTTPSSLGRSSSTMQANMMMKKESSYIGNSNNNGSNNNHNSTMGKSVDKNKVESLSSMNKMNFNKDHLIIKKENQSFSSNSSSKLETSTSIQRKDSINKHSVNLTKPDQMKMKSLDNVGSMKCENVITSRKESKHSDSDMTMNCVSTNDLSHQYKDQKQSSMESVLKHTNKERDENKEQRKQEREKLEKIREKNSDILSGHNHISSKDKEIREKLKMDKMNFIKEKEKKKNKDKFKDKDRDRDMCSKEKEMARNKAKMMERERSSDKNKDKYRSGDKEKKKYRHGKEKPSKDGRLKASEIRALLEIPDTDEPIYFSMYDKVKARSSANQNLKTAKDMDTVRQKLCQLKDKRLHRKDDSDDSEDSESDSDDLNSDEIIICKSKKLQLGKKRKNLICSSDSSSDEDNDMSDEMKRDNFKKPKKQSLTPRQVTDDEGHSDTFPILSLLEERRKMKEKKEEPLLPNNSEEVLENNPLDLLFNQKPTNKYTKKLLNEIMTDNEVHDCDDKSKILPVAKKRKKGKNKDQTDDDMDSQPVKDIKIEQLSQHERTEKMKEHQKNKKNKAERKLKERELIEKIMKQSEKQEKKSKSEEDDQSSSSVFKLSKFTKKKKKKKTKSSVKPRQCYYIRDDDESNKQVIRKLQLNSDNDEWVTASSDDNSILLQMNNTNSSVMFSDSDDDSRAKCYAKEKASKDEFYQNEKVQSILQSVRDVLKEKDIKSNLLTDSSTKSFFSLSKDKDHDDRSPTKKFFSDKSTKIKIEEEQDSSCQEIIKRKKKLNKSKEKEKFRKDSESSMDYSNKKKDRSTLADVFDTKSRDGHFSFMSPEHRESKTEFKSFLHGFSNIDESLPTSPPKTPEIISSRSASFTGDMIVPREDGSSSDSKIDEELINDAKRLEVMMAKEANDSCDSNLSGPNSPLDSTPKGLHQTDLSNLLPQLVPSTFSDSSLDSKISNNFNPVQRCYAEEAAIQSLKLQKELDLKEPDILKPTFESIPFSMFNSTTEKAADEETTFTESSSQIDELQKDPTIFITCTDEIETKPICDPIVDSAKCTEFNLEIDSQRKMEDDLAVAALLQDMDDPILEETSSHEHKSVKDSSRKLHADDIVVPSFLKIISPRTSTSSEQRHEAQNVPLSANELDGSEPIISIPLTTTTQTISQLPIVSDVNTVDDQELKAAVLEIELPEIPVIVETSSEENQTSISITPAEIMFNDDDDDLEPELIVDESVLDKSLLDDTSEVVYAEPPQCTVTKLSPIGGSIVTSFDLKPFSPEHQHVTLSLQTASSFTEVMNDSFHKEIIIYEKEQPQLPPPPPPPLPSSASSSSSTTQIDSHNSMPILTTAFDPISIKSHHETDNCNKEMKLNDGQLLQFGSFLSPRSIQETESSMSSVHLNSNDKKSPADQMTGPELVLCVEDKRDSCSESVVSDKTEIEDDSVTELFDDYDKANVISGETSMSLNNDPKGNHQLHHNQNKPRTTEDSETECESAIASSAAATTAASIGKSKRGRRAKSRKSSDSSMHSLQSENSMEHSHVSSMGTLSINTNLAATGNLLLSPTASNQSSTTTASDISPGSQSKRAINKQQQQNIVTRRSVRTAAAAANVANSSTVLDLEEEVFSLDETTTAATAVKDELHDDEIGGVKKPSKRGRKKKNSGEPQHLKLSEDENKSKKERLLLSLTVPANDIRPKSSNSPYDVFEFRDSDEDEPPITLSSSTHFMSSAIGDEKRHNEHPPITTIEQHSPTGPINNLSPTIKTEPIGTVNAPVIIASTESTPVVSNCTTNTTSLTSPISCKEYVSEVSQHGKLSITIRLQPKEEGNTANISPESTTKLAKNLIIEDSKSNDSLQNNMSITTNSITESANNTKGVRKSARLMSLVPKTTIEDTIEDVIKTTKDDKNGSKRITRSCRKSDDNGNSEVQEDSDDPKGGIVRPIRITRSRGPAQPDSADSGASSDATSLSRPAVPVSTTITTCTTITTTTSTPIAKTPKKSVESQLDQQPESTSTPVVESPETPKSIRTSQDTEPSSPATSVIQSNTIPQNIECNLKVEQQSSVIQSTGNVDRIMTNASPITSSVITSTSCSQSPVIINTDNFENNPGQYGPIITSPTYLQDIPNISERIHNSSTALKLKTGKAFIFENPAAGTATSDQYNVPTQSTLPSTASFMSTVITSSPSESQSPICSVANNQVIGEPIGTNNSVTTSASPVTMASNAPITIKPKYQPPVGQTSEIWSNAVAKPSNEATQLSITVSTTPSSVEQSQSEPSSVLINSPRNSKLTPSPSLDQTITSSMPTSVVTSHQSDSKSSHMKPSVVQVSGTSIAPHELPSQIPYPVNMAQNAQLNADYMALQQKEYYNSLQKQQLISAQQQSAQNSRSTKLEPNAFGSSEIAANTILPPSFPVLPPLRAPVPSTHGQRVMIPNLLPNEMDLLTQQQLLAASMYGIAPNLRAGQSIRPGIPLPRYIYPQGTFGLPSNSISPEVIAAASTTTRQHEMNKQQQQEQKIQDEMKQQQQQQQQKQIKKEELLRIPQMEELVKHHAMQDPSYHFDASLGAMASHGQRIPFPPNMRQFPYLPTPDRFNADPLMHPMFAVNGPGGRVPLPAHAFPSSTNSATDLSKSSMPSQSVTPDPTKRSPSVKSTSEPTYIPPVHGSFRKDITTNVQETSADVLRSQMGVHSKEMASSPRPLNMTTPTIWQSNSSVHSLPESSSSSINDQPSSLVKRPYHPSGVVDPTPIVQLPPHSNLNASFTSSTVQPGTPNPAPTSQEPVDIVQRYPVLWYGNLALKNDEAYVQMHFVNGNRNISGHALPVYAPDSGVQPQLRITQRMRIDNSQMSQLIRKLQTEEDYCILLALPSGRESGAVMMQSEKIKKYFLNYLQSKQAAGIVNTNDETHSYIVHIFPGCQFSSEHLSRFAPDLLHSLNGLSHLMVVITTNP